MKGWWWNLIALFKSKTVSLWYKVLLVKSTLYIFFVMIVKHDKLKECVNDDDSSKIKFEIEK